MDVSAEDGEAPNLEEGPDPVRAMTKLMTPLVYVALVAVGGLIIRAQWAEEPKPANAAGATIPEKHRVTAEMLASARAAEGRGAEWFRSRTADGATCALADLSLSRPLVLVFIKNGCPCSESAQPFVNRLHDLYGRRAQFAGIIDADGDEAKRWGEANRVGFPLLLDPDLEIVRKYKVKSSAYIVLVGQGGKVIQAWPGYSEATLRALGHRLAKMTGSVEQALVLADAPREMYAGCPY